jgi:glutaredoxin
VYTKAADPYSVRACTLLRMKQIDFVEKQLPEYAEEMFRVTGSGVAPQIVINGRCIGGFDVLGSLELRGELDRLLIAKRAD